MSLTLTITNAGRVALVNAANTGTSPVIIAQVGLSATAVVPSVAAVALPGEHKRIGTLSGDVVADDTIHLIVRDESADIFTVRSFGLYLGDGTLFAIYGQAAVILEKSAQAMMLLQLDIRFADIDAESLTFGDSNWLNPPATTATQGVVELATDAETEAGTDLVRAVTPKGLKTAVTNWLNSRFGADAPSAFVKTLLAAATAAAFRAALSIKSAALRDEGEGNGLNADLLDGVHAAGFLRTSGGTSTGPIQVGPAGLNVALWPSSSADARSGYIEFNGPGGRHGFIGFSPNGGKIQLTAEIATGFEFNGQLTRSGQLIWDSGNDGAGSGLDADLLDGQQGSWYADISARLGYVPLNSSSFTPGTILAHLQTVDGSGSGLDADLLDGQHGSYYADVVSRLGFTPVRQGGGAGQLSNIVRIGWSGSRLKAQVDATDMGNIVFDSHVTDVWRASNDGSGSGLDADLLDGYQAADLLPTGSLAANGWCRLPNGMILQWAQVYAAANGYTNVTWPVAFPGAAVHVSGGVATEVGNAAAADNGPLPVPGTATTTGVQLFNASNAATAWVFAIGY